MFHEPADSELSLDPSSHDIGTTQLVEEPIAQECECQGGLWDQVLDQRRRLDELTDQLQALQEAVMPDNDASADAAPQAWEKWPFTPTTPPRGEGARPPPQGFPSWDRLNIEETNEHRRCSGGVGANSIGLESASTAALADSWDPAACHSNNAWGAGACKGESVASKISMIKAQVAAVQAVGDSLRASKQALEDERNRYKRATDATVPRGKPEVRGRRLYLKAFASLSAAPV